MQHIDMLYTCIYKMHIDVYIYRTMICSICIFKVFCFQRKTLYWFCCLFSIIIIFLLDATLTGNISVVYGPIPVKFSAHKACLMLFLKTPKRITNTLPVKSNFPFPNFLTAILCHQRLEALSKKLKMNTET